MRVWALVCATLLASACQAAPGPREIRIVARGMTFVVADEGETPNPIIRVRAGETVRVVLRNEAPGLVHNFEVPAWNLRTSQLREGETTEVEFKVAADPGQYEYRCTPHARMMRGAVHVTAQ